MNECRVRGHCVVLRTPITKTCLVAAVAYVAFAMAFLGWAALLLVGLCCFISSFSDATEENYLRYMKKLKNTSGLITDESLASMFMESLADDYRILGSVSANAQWDYVTDLTAENQQTMNMVFSEVSKLHSEISKTLRRFAWRDFQNATLKRLFQESAPLGNGSFSVEKSEKMDELNAEMEAIYSETEVRVDFSGGLKIEPELAAIMREVGDYDLLMEAWSAWHNSVGWQEKDLFIPYIKLANESAISEGYGNIKEKWLKSYAMNNFTEVIDGIFEELSPLYKKLHAYVRMRLRAIYPGRMPEDGTIPAHLLGDMWSQQWGNLYTTLRNGTPIDITREMEFQKWDAKRIFETAEEFFVSLGLSPMTPTFWNKSILSQPADRNIVCHPASADFSDGDDYRIKMCTEPRLLDLLNAHHEMGHIVYYMLYSHLHPSFQAGANEAFHEMVGDLIALSVSTVSRYRHLGLLGFEYIDPIDALLQTALDKIAFLPYGYVLEKWRWSVFTGETPFEEMNKKFWEYRIKYQGVSPPLTRTETYFDPGAKYHVAINAPYISYFVSFILQFQVHEYLCSKTNKIDDDHPFHDCDIHGHELAGHILKSGLSLGKSKPWPEVLEILAGTSEMSAGSMRRYFKPLEKWLDEQIKDEVVGWDTAHVEKYVGTATVLQVSILTCIIMVAAGVFVWWA